MELTVFQFVQAFALPMPFSFNARIAVSIPISAPVRACCQPAVWTPGTGILRHNNKLVAQIIATIVMVNIAVMRTLPISFSVELFFIKR